MMADADSCFHCALPIPAGCDYQVQVAGASEPVCCPGCKAVAELILASGMENYYSKRDAPEPGAGRPEAATSEWLTFDRPDMLAAFSEDGGDFRIATVYVAGMYCSACSWLIETSLSKLKGIDSVDVNPVTHRVRIEFRSDSIGLGEILSSLANLGYKPQPLTHDSTARPELLEQRTALKRLLVASLGMMQVMMFAVALYAGELQGIDADMRHFLRLVSFLVTTPVVFYSARPFFASAIRGMRARRPGMDLPVSIAIGSAYVASVYATLSNGSAVWFDSVTMFVFFLTVGRFLEMRARHRSIDRSVALASVLPNTVTRLDGNARDVVAVAQLVAGDRVLVRQGESFPADGTLLSGDISVDEALLTGESRPLQKAPGDPLIAGSIIVEGSAEMRVTRTGVDTTLGTISRLSERARYARPAFVQTADRVASYVVVAILLVSAVVGVSWYLLDIDRAFEVTLSVLVVTCPCALALATPAAFAAAGGRLSERLLLLTNGEAIEPLSRVTHVMFDKTGTLTYGRPVVVATRVLDGRYSEQQCLAIAAALEALSTHPIADAFRDATLAAATNTRVVVAGGIVGTVDDCEWRLGKAEFVSASTSLDQQASETSTVFLGNNNGVVAVFDLSDELRPDAASTVAELRESGLKVSLLSGDGEGPVRKVADELGIRSYRFACSPEDKLSAIRQAQENDIVLMVGDGVNDAPVLSGADVSIAPAKAAKLAQTSADLIMLGNSLRPVTRALNIAKQTMRVVRQNLAWAIIYNSAALPLAAMGLVPPWLAAIGMSASSLIVVMNALRLSRL
jgi:Cu2+-exporting ATPase